MQSTQNDDSRTLLVWFSSCVPILLSCWQITEIEAPRLAGADSQSQEKNHLSAIVVLFLAINEGSVSAKQLNVHNCLAKLSTLSFKSHPK